MSLKKSTTQSLIEDDEEYEDGSRSSSGDCTFYFKHCLFEPLQPFELLSTSSPLDGVVFEREYNPNHALWCVSAAALVYASPSEISHVVRSIWGWQTFRFFDAPSTDTQAYGMASDDVIVVAFRGTESAEDWQTNKDFARVPFFGSDNARCRLSKKKRRTRTKRTASGNSRPGSQLASPSSTVQSGDDMAFAVSSSDSDGSGDDDDDDDDFDDSMYLVHRGFRAAFYAAQPQVEAFVRECRRERPNRLLYLSGHSLGGALCTLCLADFVFRGDDALAVHGAYTVGQPRVANKELRDALASRSRCTMQRIVNYTDVVPKVPPGSFGFKHCGALVYVNKRRQLYVRPAKSTFKSDRSGRAGSIENHGKSAYLEAVRQHWARSKSRYQRPVAKGTLALRGARGLRPLKAPDAYAVATFGGADEGYSWQTVVCRDSRSPNWSLRIELPQIFQSDDLVVDVFDRRTSECLGRAVIGFDTFDAALDDQRYELEQRPADRANGRSRGDVGGRICVDMRFYAINYDVAAAASFLASQKKSSSSSSLRSSSLSSPSSPTSSSVASALPSASSSSSDNGALAPSGSLIGGGNAFGELRAMHLVLHSASNLRPVSSSSYDDTFALIRLEDAVWTTPIATKSQNPTWQYDVSAPAVRAGDSIEIEVYTKGRAAFMGRVSVRVNAHFADVNAMMLPLKPRRDAKKERERTQISGSVSLSLSFKRYAHLAHAADAASAVATATVTLHEGLRLSASSKKKCDPCVTFAYEDERWRSPKVKGNGYQPKWNFSFVVPKMSAAKPLELEVNDARSGKFLGAARVLFNSFGEDISNKPYQLTGRPDRILAATHGVVVLSFEFKPAQDVVRRQHGLAKGSVRALRVRVERTPALEELNVPKHVTVAVRPESLARDAVDLILARLQRGLSPQHATVVVHACSSFSLGVVKSATSSVTSVEMLSPDALIFNLLHTARLLFADPLKLAQRDGATEAGRIIIANSNTADYAVDSLSASSTSSSSSSSSPSSLSLPSSSSLSSAMAVATPASPMSLSSSSSPKHHASSPSPSSSLGASLSPSVLPRVIVRVHTPDWHDLMSAKFLSLSMLRKATVADLIAELARKVSQRISGAADRQRILADCDSYVMYWLLDGESRCALDDAMTLDEVVDNTDTHFVFAPALDDIVVVDEHGSPRSSDEARRMTVLAEFDPLVGGGCDASPNPLAQSSPSGASSMGGSLALADDELLSVGSGTRERTATTTRATVQRRRNIKRANRSSRLVSGQSMADSLRSLSASAWQQYKRSGDDKVLLVGGAAGGRLVDIDTLLERSQPQTRCLVAARTSAAGDEALWIGTASGRLFDAHSMLMLRAEGPPRLVAMVPRRVSASRNLMYVLGEDGDCVALDVEAATLERLPANVLEWRVADVVAWLHCVELPQHSAAFEAAAIDGPALSELSDDDLRELGVTLLGHRRRMDASLRARFDASSCSHCARVLPMEARSQKSHAQEESAAPDRAVAARMSAPERASRSLAKCALLVDVAPDGSRPELWVGTVVTKGSDECGYVQVWDLRTHECTHDMLLAHGARAMALVGTSVWIGGMGMVSVVDTLGKHTLESHTAFLGMEYIAAMATVPTPVPAAASMAMRRNNTFDSPPRLGSTAAGSGATGSAGGSPERRSGSSSALLTSAAYNQRMLDAVKAHVWIGAQSGAIAVWPAVAASAAQTQLRTAHKKRVDHIVHTRASNGIVLVCSSSGQDGVIMLWDAASQRHLQTVALDEDDPFMLSLTFRRCRGERIELAICTGRNRLRVWPIDMGSSRSGGGGGGSRPSGDDLGSSPLPTLAITAPPSNSAGTASATATLATLESPRKRHRRRLRAARTSMHRVAPLTDAMIQEQQKKQEEQEEQEEEDGEEVQVVETATTTTARLMTSEERKQAVAKLRASIKLNRL
jgi:Lipase (class 3)/SAM domain (Sterile alpha motif)/C2 domain